MTEDLPHGARSSAVSVAVSVIDVNDNTPVFSKTSYETSLAAADYSGPNRILLASVSKLCSINSVLQDPHGIVNIISSSIDSSINSSSLKHPSSFRNILTFVVSQLLRICDAAF